MLPNTADTLNTSVTVRTTEFCNALPTSRWPIIDTRSPLLVHMISSVASFVFMLGGYRANRGILGRHPLRYRAKPQAVTTSVVYRTGPRRCTGHALYPTTTHPACRSMPPTTGILSIPATVVCWPPTVLGTLFIYHGNDTYSSIFYPIFKSPCEDATPGSVISDMLYSLLHPPAPVCILVTVETVVIGPPQLDVVTPATPSPVAMLPNSFFYDILSTNALSSAMSFSAGPCVKLPLSTVPPLAESPFAVTSSSPVPFAAASSSPVPFAATSSSPVPFAAASSSPVPLADASSSPVPLAAVLSSATAEMISTPVQINSPIISVTATVAATCPTHTFTSRALSPFSTRMHASNNSSRPQTDTSSVPSSSLVSFNEYSPTVVILMYSTALARSSDLVSHFSAQPPDDVHVPSTETSSTAVVTVASARTCGQTDPSLISAEVDRLCRRIDEVEQTWRTPPPRF
ncbi:hypothetical protein C2E23DRAFT_862533 [Lenzites betulinus]|nr:hypothetical protein C2E23DRAFT_862533 [Lenzites betulinus]